MTFFPGVACHIASPSCCVEVQPLAPPHTRLQQPPSSRALLTWRPPNLGASLPAPRTAHCRLLRATPWPRRAALWCRRETCSRCAALPPRRRPAALPCCPLPPQAGGSLPLALACKIGSSTNLLPPLPCRWCTPTAGMERFMRCPCCALPQRPAWCWMPWPVSAASQRLRE